MSAPVVVPVAVDDQPEAVAAIAAAIERAQLVAFDLEFLAQDRLVPTLCLVQIAWVDGSSFDAASGAKVSADANSVASPSVRLLDPLAVDVASVIRALAAHPCVVAHAPRQDLAILAARFALPASGWRGLIDTQVMAAFAGIGDQVGFASLANDLLGLRLGKELQWTNWAQRPLSDAQLAYAAADVRYLPAIYNKLAARLDERLAWARAESAQIVADAEAAARVTPETAWQQIGGLRGMDAATLAAVVSLAAWRQRTCIELERPLGQVLNEKVLVELARNRPTNPGAIRTWKGISGLARERAADIVAAIDAADPSTVATLPAGRPASARAQRWAEMLIAIAQLVADESKVAVRLLATRSDAEEFARAVDERGVEAAQSLPALASWRRDVLGRAWLGWLTGAVALVGDTASPNGLKLR